MEILENWMASERGNTWLSDDDGNHFAWFRVGGRFLEVSVTPGNSPGLWIRLLPEVEGEKDIARHINLNLQGWTVRRCNVEGVNVGQDNMVS